MPAGCQGRYFSTVTGAQLAPAGAGVKLRAVNVTKATATAVITVYNGTSTSGTAVAVIDGNAVQSYDFGGIICNAGLYVDQTVAGAQFTISWE